MSTPTDRRSRKRLALRQSISDTATGLFFERGFEAVTIDEIAAAADVGRMTVFNHFPRKEDLFFDRDEEVRDVLQGALRQRDPAIAPIESLRRLTHRLVTEDRPYIRFSAGSRQYVETVENSPNLKARARAIRDEFSHSLAVSLAECAGGGPPDAVARLAAGLILATWSVAFIEAHQAFRRSGDSDDAKRVFLALVDRGMRGVSTAMADTPYA